MAISSLSLVLTETVSELEYKRTLSINFVVIGVYKYRVTKFYLETVYSVIVSTKEKNCKYVQ